MSGGAPRRAWPARVRTEADLVRSRRQPRRPRALPRVRALALRRRAPVPPRADPRARGPGSRRRAEPHLRRGRRRACSTRSTSTSLGCGASRVGARGWCTGSTGRSARTGGSTTAPTRGSRKSTPRSRPRRSSSRSSRSRSTASSASSCGSRSVIPNAVDPAIFHPPASREPLDGRRVRLIASSWSDNPRKGGGDARVARPQPRPRPLRAHLRRAPARRIRALPRRRPARLDRARRPSPDAGRLRRAEPRRPLLERPARGARVRPAGRLPRQRRASGARRRGRAPVPGRTRSSVTCSIASSPSSTSVAQRSRPRRSRRSRTATSRCSACAWPPRLPRRGELPATGHPRRALPCRQAARPGRGLARPRRPLPVRRVDRGDVARRSGAQEPARSLGLPGDHVRDEARPRGRDRARTAAGAPPSSPRCATFSARERSSRSTSSRCATTTRPIRGSPTSAAAPRPTPTSSPRFVPARRASGRS